MTGILKGNRSLYIKKLPEYTFLPLIRYCVGLRCQKLSPQLSVKCAKQKSTNRVANYVNILNPKRNVTETFTVSLDHNMTILHLVKVVRDVFEDKCQILTWCSEAKFLYVDLNSLHDLHDISTSGYYEGENTSTTERECCKTKKNHQKLITKRKHKAPYLTQSTKIGKVIKRFRTAAFTDLDQWQFVLKLSGHVSFIILNMCTK